MPTKKKIVVLLPMKANSERVKGKNFKDFNGKPLFKWILDTLLSVELIDTIVINTDAREILDNNDLRENDRVLIRDRRPDLCGDMVSMNLVLADDIANVDADIYLMTHTTNPFLSAGTITKAIKKFIGVLNEGLFDSLFTVDRIQTRFYKADGSAVNHDPDNLIRTQDLEPWFEENSNLYLFTKDGFESTKARIGRRPVLFESPRFESIDIDDQEDWNFALIAAKYLIHNNNL
jgi:CMP-N-acetylneuraminic acid synthetase